MVILNPEEQTEYEYGEQATAIIGFAISLFLARLSDTNRLFIARLFFFSFLLSVLACREGVWIADRRKVKGDGCTC